MGLFANAFTWWNGASWGTSLMSRRHGAEAGRDEAGNVYFKHRDDPARRWVIYAGANDSSQIPPGWNAWLRGRSRMCLKNPCRPAARSNRSRSPI